MLAACLLAALPWLSVVSAADSHCSDFDEDTEETSLILTHSTRAELGAKFSVGNFDKPSGSGYFTPTDERYSGKKIFFSKNSCATVLYCLKSVYGLSDDTKAWGRQSPATQEAAEPPEEEPEELKKKRWTVLKLLCDKRPSSRWCRRLVPRQSGRRLMMPGHVRDRLGPKAHLVCREHNFLDEGKVKGDSFIGCMEWMQPFMNQLAQTLGSSSERYNLFLDFGSEGIKACLGPPYNQECVDKSLAKSVAEADVFLFFPDWFCGDSCATELNEALKVQSTTKPGLEIIELDWDSYFELFLPFDAPPNPENNPLPTGPALVNEWRAGSRAGLHILQAIQLFDFYGTRTEFIPDAECWEEGLCISGDRYHGYKTAGGAKCDDNTFCGCLPAGQCTSVGQEKGCCSNVVQTLQSGQPCFEDFHQFQNEAAPHTGICT